MLLPIKFPLLVLVSLTFPGLADTRDAEFYLIRNFEKINSFRANLEQVVLDSGETYVGNIWFKKPNFYRLEMNSPISQYIVSDGAYIWTHDVDLDQVIVKDVDQSAADMSLTLLIADPISFLDGNKVTRFPGEKTDSYLVEMETEDSIVKNVMVGFTSGRLSSFLLEPRVGDPFRIVFNEVVLNQPIKQSVFRFSVPPDVDLIDDR
ncbi:MAG: hypothetical protein CMQ40_11845 [Gammaproteobacteria bacterium]|nr:hypothetical protein [Gammaproteobacteria bacterium]